MKFAKSLLTAGLAVAALTVSAAPALAINNTCANREAMLVGSTENWSVAGSASAYFATRLTAGRSYVVLAWTPFQDASETAGAVNLTLYSDTSCTTAASVTSVETREPFSNLAAADIDAFAVIPPTTGQYVLQVANLTATTISHRIIIFESSIYSPWWITTGTNGSFVTLSNRSNISTSATVTLNTFSGAQCGSTTVVVPANGNTYVYVNTVGTCGAAGGTFGSAQIAFISTPGTIQANTTVLDTVNGVSFDEPFVPRMQWVITER